MNIWTDDMQAGACRQGWAILLCNELDINDDFREVWRICHLQGNDLADVPEGVGAPPLKKPVFRSRQEAVCHVWTQALNKGDLLCLDALNFLKEHGVMPPVPEEVPL